MSDESNSVYLPNLREPGDGIRDIGVFLNGAIDFKGPDGKFHTTWHSMKLTKKPMTEQQWEIAHALCRERVAELRAFDGDGCEAGP